VVAGAERATRPASPIPQPDQSSSRGQIIGHDHREYWVHRKEFIGVAELRTGQRVAFTPTEAPRGPRATAVRPLEERGG